METCLAQVRTYKRYGHTGFTIAAQYICATGHAQNYFIENIHEQFDNSEPAGPGHEDCAKWYVHVDCSDCSVVCVLVAPQGMYRMNSTRRKQAVANK